MTIVSQTTPMLHAPSRSKHSSPRPEIRLVAIDIDGTLLRSDKTLSPAVIDSVKAVSRRGVRVVLASARPPRGIRAIYERLGLNTLQINYNGALIHDAHRRLHVYHRPLPPRLAKRIATMARRRDPHVGVYAEILDRWYTDRAHEQPQIETAKTFPPDYVGPLESFLHLPITKLMLVAPPQRLQSIRRIIYAQFSRSVGFAISDPHVLQIIHRDVDKAAALRLTATHYGVQQDQVMAIGDAPNDIGMLRWARLGVALANAWEQTRQAAHTTAPSNDDDGVAVALQEHILRP